MRGGVRIFTEFRVNYLGHTVAVLTVQGVDDRDICFYGPDEDLEVRARKTFRTRTRYSSDMPCHACLHFLQTGEGFYKRRRVFL